MPVTHGQHHFKWRDGPVSCEEVSYSEGEELLLRRWHHNGRCLLVRSFCYTEILRSPKLPQPKDPQDYLNSQIFFLSLGPGLDGESKHQELRTSILFHLFK